MVRSDQSLSRVRLFATPGNHKLKVCNRHVLFLVTQSCLSLCDPMGCSPPSSSVHGDSPARILEWVAMPSSRDLPNPGIEPRPPALQGESLLSEPSEKPYKQKKKHNSHQSIREESIESIRRRKEPQQQKPYRNNYKRKTKWK